MSVQLSGRIFEEKKEQEKAKRGDERLVCISTVSGHVFSFSAKRSLQLHTEAV